MRGSVKIFTWFKIPVFIHWSFSLFMAYGLWQSYTHLYSLSAVLWGGAVFVVLFTSVLLHEYGHALMARRFGVNTRDILLTPIGGIARLERIPEKPVHEFQVALAGPMVNVAIAGLLLLVARLVFQEDQWLIFKWFLGNLMSEDTLEGFTMLMLFMAQIILANVVLVVFNMIPAFPMDGGRVLRALLAMRIGKVRATRIAAIIGQILAVGFVLLSYVESYPLLAVIGVLVFFMARSENAMVRLDAQLRRFHASDLMRSQYARFSDEDSMRKAAELLPRSLERSFLVFDEQESLVGLLTEENIMEAEQQKDLDSPVRQYMLHEVTVISPQESLLRVYFLLKNEGNPLLAVADRSGLQGVIDDTGLQNFLRQKSN